MPQRLGGQQGAIYLQGQTTKLADSYMWQFEGQQTVLDATVKGEDFKRYMPDVGEARVRMQCFVPGPQAKGTELTHVWNQTLVPTAGGGIPIDFILDMIDHNVPNGFQTIVGQGYIIRAQLHVVRDGIITDEIEIQVDGRPTVVN